MDDMEVQRMRFRNYAKISADISATITTIVLWIGIAVMSVKINGSLEAPMIAGTMTTMAIWSLRKME